MQNDLANDQLWNLGRKIAEQGLLFAVLTGFIIGSYMRKIAWGWQITELQTQLDKRDAKIEKLEAENRAMLEITRVNTQTTSAAVDGFQRALDEIKQQRHWDGRERRQ